MRHSIGTATPKHQLGNGKAWGCVRHQAGGISSWQQSIGTMSAKRNIQEAVSPFVPCDSPALKPLLWDSSLRQVLDESPLQRD